MIMVIAARATATRRLEHLAGKGLRLRGIVKVLESKFDNDDGCNMDVRVLPAGPDVRSTQNQGSGSAVCRLDPTAITAAVAKVESSNAPPPSVICSC